MSSDTQTFLFADLAGFAALTDTHGDEAAADLAQAFCAEVRELLPERAEAVKNIGDAVMVRCGEASAALLLGLSIVHDVGERHGFPVVRVGMHTGPAVERGGDWYGNTVNVAARLSNLARGGEVLLTGETLAAAGTPEGIEIVGQGRHRLKNIAEEVAVYLARRAGAGERLPIDPVCHMAVQPGRCAGSLDHRDVTYHFCSLDCAARFAAEPERYAVG